MFLDIFLEKLFRKYQPVEKEPENELYEMKVTDIEDEEERNRIIKKAKEQYGYYLGVNEYYRYMKFCEKHRNCCRNADGTPKCGAIGGGIQVSFEGTGLGNLVTCKCKICGAEADLTDVDCW